jgi:exosome complex RNA-binding protein Rrp4
MVKNTAQFHMTMLLSRYSNSLADMFQMEFQHRERERSSDRSEITEINDYWYARICEYDARAAKELQTCRTPRSRSGFGHLTRVSSTT